MSFARHTLNMSKSFWFYFKLWHYTKLDKISEPHSICQIFGLFSWSNPWAMALESHERMFAAPHCQNLLVLNSFVKRLGWLWTSCESCMFRAKTICQIMFAFNSFGKQEQYQYVANRMSLPHTMQIMLCLNFIRQH